MKTIYTPLVILTLMQFSLNIQPVNSQNWNLLNINERYHYNKTGDSIPLYILSIDSLLVQGNDTIFYMNRFFLPCDTCQTQGFYLDNQPSFLQREWVKSGRLITMQSPNTMFIQVSGTVDTEWWFDAEETQKAKITSRQIESVFGKPDSVITISINDVMAIKLSKQHGVLQFFEFTLSGMEYNNLGKCLPGFNEFFDFKVGDVFQYNQGGMEPDNGSYGGTYKYTVKNITKTNSEITVRYDVKFRPQFFPYEGICEQFNETTTYKNSHKHLANSYPNQKININEYFNDEIPDGFYSPRPDEGFTTVSMEVVNNKLTKKIGFEFRSLPNHLLFHDSLNLYSVNDDGNSSQLLSWVCKYQMGIGKSLKEFAWFENGNKIELIGYIKDGIQTGTVYSDSYMLDYTDELYKSVNVYPNPANDYIYIDAKLNGTTKITLINSHGMVVATFNYEQEHPIFVGNLTSGIYFIQMKSANQTIIKKVSIIK